jgi:hypothetical protein
VKKTNINGAAIAARPLTSVIFTVLDSGETADA